MRCSVSLTLLYLLAEQCNQVTAGLVGVDHSALSAGAIFSHNSYLARKTRRKSPVHLNHENYYQKRQQIASGAPTSSVSTAATPAVVATATSSIPALSTVPASSSNTTLNTACQMALSQMADMMNASLTSNPSGLAACYNIPVYDNMTGEFQADLQMYRIAAATGEWTSIQQNSVNISLDYPGASIAMENLASLPTTSATTTTTSSGNDSSVLATRANMPVMVAELAFVGKVDNSSLGELTNVTAMRAALLPAITVSAMSPNGSILTTSISSTDASYVSGNFIQNDAAATTNGTSAIPAVATPVAAAVVFSVPGMTLGIFPVGLVITSIWTVLFVLAVGAGTLGRMQFRDAYRRRCKMEGAARKAPY
ncbi:hypothetical protein MMC25_003198 [Agyrium rufum]|nr:hypothetical protein [Agyrium rufum]